MVPLPRLCALWGCLLTAVHLGQCLTCSDKQYLYNGQCCDLCQPGTRLTSHCTALEKTQCQACGTGEFLAHWNTEIRCHQHRHCEPNQGLQIKKEGTTDSDTVCACKEGQHCTSKECETCVQHTPCGPGFGVVEMATETTDTVCQPCPDGFFSSESSLSEKCRPWTRCEDKNLVVLREGTSQNDTVCGFQFRMRALLVIPVVVVILIIIFVVFLYIKKAAKKPKDNEAFPPEAQRQDPVEIEDYPGHNTAAPVQETLHGCQPVAQEDGKESRISVQERQVTGSIALRPLV
ncbi:tumor necrosis factor receptor superfamily member 5 isoform X1 [Apodemus sylvaticus]|uniref:tumor necrosis factor receptor superfamily member 5 isoform X1 n=1 Tax=Apodemus sylvaticus TaxID=10129 RepID=UPI00224413CF|nr:tumor necrosis factor receptor superfamily member 5 isoform X1 [Apodemus sylvaticus]